MDLRKSLRGLFHYLGLDIRRFNPDNFAVHRRQKFIRSSDINLALDVGAFTGEYGKTLRDLGYRGRIISFEPLSAPFGKLSERSKEDDLWLCFNEALGNSDKELMINVSRNTVSSSILPMLEVHESAAPESAYIGQEKIAVQRLDSRLLMEGALKGDERILLKIDTQGFEKNVLAGATKCLKFVHLLEIELSLVSLYEGQSNFHDMILYLADLGFHPISLERGLTNPNSGEMLQVDAIFYRR